MKYQPIEILRKLFFPLFLVSIVVMSLLYVNSMKPETKSQPDLSKTILSVENDTVQTSLAKSNNLIKPAINFKDENNSKCMTREQRSISVSNSLKSLGLNTADLEIIMKDYIATTNLIEDKSHNLVNVGMMTHGRLINSIEVSLRHRGVQEKNIKETLDFARSRLSTHMGIKYRPDLDKVCVGTVNDILFISYVRSYISSLR